MMITISGKNFSFQATQIKNGTSIIISSAGEVKFNNVALEAKMQSAEKSDQNQSKKSSNASYSNSVPSRSDTKDIKPEVTRGKPFPGGEPPKVVEPLPKAPEVITLVPTEEVVLGDALEPPNGEFQVLDSKSKVEPRNSLPRDIVRVPSLDNIQFVETDLSRELKAEAAGGFDDDLISLTGIQPEVASEPQLEVPKGIIPGDAQPPKLPTVINELGEPLFEIPEQIILGDALPPPPGGFQVLPSTKPAETGKPEQIVLGDALDPPNGEFQIAGSPSKTEPTRNIPRDIVRVPSLDNIQFVETDLSRELKAEQKRALTTNEVVKPNLFSFTVSK